MRKIVLVIDDDAETSALVSAILSQAYDIETAADGQQGIKLARQRLPNLIVCDIMMPRMNGIELLDAMGRERPLAAVPVITMSGWDLDSSTQGVLASHANYRGHMRKPLQIEEVMAKARAALGDLGVAAPAEVASRQPRVLVAEDDSAARQLLVAVFGSSYQVVQAQDGREAWGHIRRQIPDVLVLDLVMPGATGFELLREMSAHAEVRGLPVVIVTAVALGASESAVLLKDFPNVRQVLRKPAEPEALRAAVDAALRQA